MSFSRTHVSFRSQINIVFWLAALVTFIEILNIFLGRSLNTFGLIPRDLNGLVGIVAAPFLHGSLMHYLSNIVPLCFFSFLVLQHGVVRFSLVTFFSIVLSGFLVWIFARTAIHVGASGLIYGYFGYLLLAGWLSREIKLILISLFIGVVYGGLVFGVFPSNSYVSWEGHLFGFMSGVGCALIWGRVKKK
ncbi:MAG: membrane associated rhomboid family serine protease [Pseudohongiellaceae bacterium]|jgi:membrane associated rhomboid family serine protease